TLTTGVMTMSDAITDGDREDFIRVVGSLEAASGHPIGKAVALGADELGIDLVEPAHLESLSGLGVVGEIGDRQVVVGKAKLLEDRGLEVGEWASELARLEETGKTAFVAGWDGRARGVVAVTDVVRPEAGLALARLREQQKRVVMITGDNQRTARRIAAQLGIDDVRAEVLPGEKASQISALQDEGSTVVFVGDGVNDAPALTQADLAMAVGSGTEVALEAGDVVLLNGDPRLVPAGIDLAHATFRTIRQNLLWAFGYNTAAIPIAALGLLNPMIAAGAMAFSSVSVVLNALRLRRFRPFWE
ncbi:MAG: HAD-IC family P-type ATPase, partial [Acidimicrobiia bacterium]